ncbi:response regulator [Rhizobium leguminosarum]|uniref:response regulator n=1 Tax=Rhizobium leguminosarum TaxID=384 RepID=UPI001C91CAAA|nr:response regulator [Rhizobium leguminosarum]MBY2968132.1 response regulator [Rhizobium leguminosarum]
MNELSGIRVLIVEDEGFVALLIEDMLQDLGCETVASVAGLQEACAIAETAEIDLAVLDVNLAGQHSFPVAEVLRERGVPFLFSTGYGTSALPSEFSGCPVLAKPFSAKAFEQTLTVALAMKSAL